MNGQKECKHEWVIKLTKFGVFEVCKKCKETKQAKNLYGGCHGPS